MSAPKKTALVGSAAQKARLGAKRRRDAWEVDPEELHSPRSDSAHPEHETWKARTDPRSALFQELLGLMRANGTHDGTPIVVYSDGGRPCIAAGDRRHACACALAAERRQAGNREPVTLRAVTTKNPALARNLENAGRLDDNPMQLAVRFDMHAETLGEKQTAAMMGMNLDYARALRKCLLLPADTQGQIARRELPPDVAVRAARDGGSPAVRRVVEGATSNGTIDQVAARKAARDASPPRKRALPRKEAEAFAVRLSGAKGCDRAARAVRFVLGQRDALDGCPDLVRLLAGGAA